MLEQKTVEKQLTAYTGRTWAEVDLDQALANYLSLKSGLRAGSVLMPVVKANAYGHGAVELARIYEGAGAPILAVACLDEVLELRQAGLTVPLLMLSEGEPERHREGILANATYTVYSLAQAQKLDREARALGRQVTVHLKLDSGMGRIGFVPGAESLQEILTLSQYPGLNVEGIFTHFATADGFDLAESDSPEPGEAYLQEQFQRFTEFLSQLEAEGLSFRYRHCCNSAATLRHPDMHLDAVRVGLALYGLKPDNCELPDGVRPLMQLKSRVLQVKTLSPGQSVSYGRRFVAESAVSVATVPVGYADGYPRSLHDRAEAVVGGRRVPLIGTVCMDATIFDVTGIEAEAGTELLLWGGEELPAEEFASWQGTINYEVPCQLSRRVPRVYLRNDVPKRITRVGL